jgi:hypothetical protein
VYKPLKNLVWCYAFSDLSPKSITQLKLFGMKKLLISGLIACLFCLPAFAQDNKKADKQKEYAEWQQKVKDELKMTDEQVNSWNALETEYKEKMNATKQATDLDKDAQKTKMVELRKEKNAKFLELLSADQQEKYKELIEKKKKEAEANKPAGSN